MHRPAVILLLSDAITPQVRGRLEPEWVVRDHPGEGDLVVVGPGREQEAEDAAGVVVSLGADARPGWIALAAGDLDRLVEIAGVVRTTARRQRLEQQDLCAVLAHDVKNPLGAALANVGFLSDVLSGQPTDIVEALSEVTEALGRARGIVDDALALAQAGAKELEPNARPQRASEIFEDVLRRTRAHATARQVELRAVPTGATVTADGELVRRALTAMVEAALKQCTRKATVELAYARDRDASRLVVRHDGRKLVDQPHARAISEGRGRTGSIGMPLALARVIALAHGGRLEASASADWPTELTLVLPE